MRKRLPISNLAQSNLPSPVQDEICEDLCAVSVQASMQEYNVTDVSVKDSCPTPQANISTGVTPENITAGITQANISTGVTPDNITAGVTQANISTGVTPENITAGVTPNITAGVDVDVDQNISIGVQAHISDTSINEDQVTEVDVEEVRFLDFNFCLFLCCFCLFAPSCCFLFHLFIFSPANFNLDLLSITMLCHRPT